MLTSGSARRLDEASAPAARTAGNAPGLGPAALRDGRPELRPQGARQGRRRQLWLARALLTAAVLGASYLAYFSLSGRALPGCRPEDGCGDALSSSWANWLGVPVSLPAVALYSTLLAATFAAPRKLSPVSRRRLWIASLALGSTILAAAIWFVGLQMFALEQWCKWCTTTHVLASAAAAIMIHQARVATRPPRPRRPILSTKEVKWVAAGAAALGWVVLAAGQLASPPPAAAVTAAIAPNASALPEAKGLIVLHDGKFKLNAAELPLIGPANAKATLVGLFDYTCHHCRETRRVVKKAIERASGRLAIVSLPMPLDKACNPLVTRTTKEHTHACEYAALGLAVFRAKPAAFGEFDDWLFGPVDPPSIKQARVKAMDLVGAEPLSRALRDPWIGERLVNNIALYEANAHASGGDTRLPQIVIGDTLIQGTISNPDDLFQLLAQHATRITRSSDVDVENSR
jgi:uncharacterized membrane protein